MSDWTAGYISDVTYTYGYYQELNPVRAQFALTMAGYAIPDVRSACELGFGQGLSMNIHAACSDTAWWGTDFNPSQAAFAQELGASTGADVHLFDQSFAEFAQRTDLPGYDFIGLHGIWSWVSDDNRRTIIDLVRSRLNVGGMLYISYNTFPGWAAFAPMRHLMTEHAEVLGAEGRGIVSRIDGAMEFAEQLLATNPAFSRANPFVGERLKKIQEHDRHYLAHEYFNRDWQPMHFADMADWLVDAKVQFGCSANLLDMLPAINLTEEQQQFLSEIPDRMFRESVRDFMLNQQFRKDYWIKGARKLDPRAWMESCKRLRIVLMSHRPDVKLKVTGALGEADLSELVYVPILDYLADHQIRTVTEVAEAVASKKISLAQVLQALQLLVGAGHLAPVHSGELDHPTQGSQRLNTKLLERAMGSNDINYLASPLVGGVSVTRFQQLFLRALEDGLEQPDQWAESAWQVLSAQGQRLVKDGSTIESAEENLAELKRQAKEFAEKRLACFRAVQII